VVLLPVVDVELTEVLESVVVPVMVVLLPVVDVELTEVLESVVVPVMVEVAGRTCWWSLTSAGGCLDVVPQQ